MEQPTLAPCSRTAPLLSMRGISKRFGAVQALDGVDLDVQPGEVHAIVGENGAGKSTLMHVLCGARQPDAGSIALGGEAAVRIENEHLAQQLGIAIVFQERSLFPTLSIAENIFAGRQPTGPLGTIRHRDMHSAARSLLLEVGLDVDPRIALGRLPPAHQQLVEIAKALSLDFRLIIFDEPTAALTGSETKRLFGVIDGLRQRGKSIIWITHRLEEIFELADRVTVLKDGRKQTTLEARATSSRELIALMVGRELADLGADKRPARGPVALRVENLSEAADAPHAVRVRNVSLTVQRGEIVALAGLAGAGRTETALCLFGARAFATGTIEVDGAAVRIRSVADAIRAGIGYVPEDRKEGGLFLEMSIAENIAAASLHRFGSPRVIARRVAEAADEYRQRLGIACRTVHQSAGSLSGGNQQKVLLAKWLLAEPKVLIVDEPTRGVDVGARAEVHRLLVELAARGTAVLVISSDLPEVLSLADRVIVMSEGRVAGELAREEATEERILRLASQVA